MTKTELIDTVRELNPTASVTFLTQFNQEELREYIEHLLEVHKEDLSAVATASFPYN